MSMHEAEGDAIAGLDPAAAKSASGAIHIALLSLGPIVLALAISAALLVILGVNPLTYYAVVVERGLVSPLGLEQSITRMGPLLLVAAGLIVAFRAGIWNLGVEGQVLLGAVFAAARVGSGSALRIAAHTKDQFRFGS